MIDRFQNLAKKHLLEQESKKPQVKGFFVKKEGVDKLFGPIRANEVPALNKGESLIPTMIDGYDTPYNPGVFM